MEGGLTLEEACFFHLSQCLKRAWPDGHLPGSFLVATEISPSFLNMTIVDAAQHLPQLHLMKNEYEERREKRESSVLVIVSNSKEGDNINCEREAISRMDFLVREGKPISILI